MSTEGRTSIINVQLDENDEIEYVDVAEEEEEEEGEDGGENSDNEQTEEIIDDEPILVSKGDGVMTIKLKTVLEHVCGKCNKTYKSITSLKRHLNLCRNRPFLSQDADETDPDMEFANALKLTDFSAVDEDTCFCCLEPKVTAHSGHVKCNFCPKSFKSHINLERHLFTLHSANTNFACTSCNATCPSQIVLNLHVESHTVGKPFSCQHCGKDFTRKYHLDRHLQYTGCDKSRPKVELPCQVCNRIFTRVDNLREHLRGHIGQGTRRKDYQCMYCDKQFYGSSLLSIHIRTHTGEKPFSCDLCEKSFPSNGALRKHRRMHTGERPYGCKICEKSFSAKETLNRHMKTHTGERPHSCNICGKSFIQATQLRAHVFHHTGENAFACKLCDSVFNRKARLDKHIKDSHQDVSGPPAAEICDICNQIFETAAELKRHLPIHNKDIVKDITCLICNKQFKTNASLAMHKKTHDKKEPCTCSVCKRSFIRIDSLMRHMKKEHKEVLYSFITSDARQADVAETEEEECTTEMESFEVVNEEVEEDFNEDIDIVVNTNEEKAGSTFIIKTVKIEPLTDKSNYTIRMENEPKRENEIVNLSDEELNDKIFQLLNLLIDEQTLSDLGVATTSVEDILRLVIEQCGQSAVDYDTCPDYGSKMRENAKILFTSVIYNESIKELLNNQTVDEVILHVLKLAS